MPIHRCSMRCRRCAWASSTGHSGGLRGARLLGRRGRRPWHHHRRQPALPPDAPAGNPRTARPIMSPPSARACARTSPSAASRHGQGHGHSQCRGHRQLRTRRHARCRLKRSLGLEGATVLGFIGSVLRLRRAGPSAGGVARHAASRRADLRVLLVGGGPQEAALKAQAQQLGVADKVVFTGRVPHAEVQRYYDLVDVLTYPRHSMRLTELVTPLKPLEAMAQGRAGGQRRGWAQGTHPPRRDRHPVPRPAAPRPWPTRC
jgi:hypothetical protein